MSLKCRIASFTVLLVALNTVFPMWYATRVVQQARLRSISVVIRDFAFSTVHDVDRLRANISFIAPGSTVLTFQAKDSALPVSMQDVSPPVVRSMKDCLISGGKVYIRDDVAGIGYRDAEGGFHYAVIQLSHISPWPWVLSLASTGFIAICFLSVALVYWWRKYCSIPITRITKSVAEFTFRKPSGEAYAEGLQNSLVMAGIGDEIANLEQAIAGLLHRADQYRKETDARETQHLKWLSYLTHDLSSPLARTLSRLQLLEIHHGMSTIEQGQHLEAIDRDIRRTMDVIGSVSQFAMLEGNIQRNFVPISVVDLLEQTSRIFEFEACRKGVEIDLQIEPSIGTINAEKLLLRRAVENLISNALRFSPEGGIIAVMAKRAGGLISLSVADTGLGISDEDLPRIFDYAFQGTDQRLPCVHGEMGVGLALVKKVAELHGGRVAAKNREDRGAEFTLFLPIAPCPLNAASPAQPVTHSSYTSQ